ncbi:MAG: tetratricopeptide repeat protein, partial [Rhodothalassiaceae bacterium]
TPLLEKLVREQKGKVALIKLDVDRNPDIAAQLRIQSIPTVYAFYKGQPLDAFQGALPESQLRSFIERLIESAGMGQSPAERLLAEAAAALAEGDSDRAAEILGAVQQMEPGDSRAVAGLAEVALARGEREEAQRLLDSIPEKDADRPEVKKARAALDLAAEADEAGDVAALRTRLEAAPDDLSARFDLARALAAHGDREAAAQHLLEIVRRDRDWQDGAAREQLLKMFDAAGAADPFTRTWRRRLSSVLFA